jgi:integrase
MLPSSVDFGLRDSVSQPAATRSAWEAALGAAGVEGFHVHDLRHTFASWLIQRGRSLKEVQEALGHQTMIMTMRYRHLAPDHLRAAVAVLDGVLPTTQPTQPANVSARASAQEAARAEELLHE